MSKVIFQIFSHYLSLFNQRFFQEYTHDFMEFASFLVEQINQNLYNFEIKCLFQDLTLKNSANLFNGKDFHVPGLICMDFRNQKFNILTQIDTRAYFGTKLRSLRAFKETFDYYLRVLYLLDLLLFFLDHWLIFLIASYFLLLLFQSQCLFQFTDIFSNDLAGICTIIPNYWQAISRQLNIISQNNQIRGNTLTDLTVFAIQFSHQNITILNMRAVHDNGFEKFVNLHKNDLIGTIKQFKQYISAHQTNEKRAQQWPILFTHLNQETASRGQNFRSWICQQTFYYIDTFSRVKSQCGLLCYRQRLKQSHLLIPMRRVLNFLEDLTAHFYIMNQLLYFKPGAIAIIHCIIIRNMMKQNLKTYSQSSEPSIDSSVFSSVDSSLQSTQSLPRDEKQEKKSNYKSQRRQLNFESPKEMPRFGLQNRDSDIFGNFQQPFIGFVGMGKAKNAIHVNQSKLKRAKKFMDLDDSFVLNSPTMSQKDKLEIEANLSTQDKNRALSNQINGEQVEDFPDFSCGFKSMGTGAVIKISSQAADRAKSLFKDFDISQKKQTKAKILKLDPTNQERLSTNFVKTQKTKPHLQKQIRLKKKNAMSSGSKLIQNISTKVEQYQRIRLSDLPKVQARKFADFWTSYQYQNSEHKLDDCTVKWCYFCQKYKDKVLTITKSFYLEQMARLLQLQQTTKQRLPKLLDLTLFKFNRFQYFDPSIVNKKTNPNNIILELYKKCLFYEKQKVSPLELSVTNVLISRGKNLGKQIVLIVVSISFCQQTNAYFAQLSDGWTSVYAVISQSNELFFFVNRKLIVGSKLEIVNWSIHPVCNMIESHPDPKVASSGAVCIEVNYNNSMPADFWAKLGFPKEPFYRPVSKCKQAGGSIPLVEGIVLRMFTIKNSKGIGVSYLEVLLTEGKCMIMKIALAEQVSLVQLFRLYYSYHFLRVKKLSNSLLQFPVSSKFYQIEDKERMGKVKQVFKNRLLNTTLKLELDEVAKQNSKKVYIDLVTKSDEVQLQGNKISIDQKIEGTVLLQQYSITNLGNGYVLSRGDRGSCLRRIPKIYDHIQYSIL